MLDNARPASCKIHKEKLSDPPQTFQNDPSQIKWINQDKQTNKRQANKHTKDETDKKTGHDAFPFPQRMEA